MNDSFWCVTVQIMKTFMNHAKKQNKHRDELNEHIRFTLSVPYLEQSLWPTLGFGQDQC